MRKTTTSEMELAVHGFFNHSSNIIIPNGSWGMFPGHHECDIVVLTRAGCLYEVEIKVSRADLRADLRKGHGHKSKYMKYLYFAIPEYLLDSADLVPGRAGILVVYEHAGSRLKPSARQLQVRVHREPVRNSAYKADAGKRSHLLYLAALRVWPLKRKVLGLRRSLKQANLELKELKEKYNAG